MSMFYVSIMVAILSAVLYQISQRKISPIANPALSLLVTYIVCIVLCAVVLGTIYKPDETLSKSFRHIGWPVVTLALAVFGMEMGYLLMYRFGWKISVGGLLVNTVSAVLLVPIGATLFGERISTINQLGIVLCILGVILITMESV